MSKLSHDARYERRNRKMRSTHKKETGKTTLLKAEDDMT